LERKQPYTEHNTTEDSEGDYNSKLLDVGATPAAADFPATPQTKKRVSKNMYRIIWRIQYVNN
jgi:hypothetical protein